MCIWVLWCKCDPGPSDLARVARIYMGGRPPNHLSCFLFTPLHVPSFHPADPRRLAFPGPSLPLTEPNRRRRPPWPPSVASPRVTTPECRLPSGRLRAFSSSLGRAPPRAQGRCRHHQDQHHRQHQAPPPAPGAAATVPRVRAQVSALIPCSLVSFFLCIHYCSLGIYIHNTWATWAGWYIAQILNTCKIWN